MHHLRFDFIGQFYQFIVSGIQQAIAFQPHLVQFFNLFGFAFEQLIQIVDKGNGRFGKLAVAHGFKPKAQQLLFQINFVDKDFNRVGVQLAGVFGQDKLFFAADFIGSGVDKRAVQLLFPFLLFQIATGVGFGDLFQNVF